MRQIALIYTALFITVSMFAQTPEKMSYQAVVRDGNNNLVSNRTVGMQISILQGAVNGTAVYVETQIPNTNANGLVSIEIGTGTILSGDFTAIDWSNGSYFIKTETDLSGGTTYTITGVSQLLSVPYALHAKTAETVTGSISETDPIFSGSQATNITATDITNLSNLSGINTGDQDLSALATKTELSDSVAQIRSEIPDVSSLIATETDPTFSSSQAANITATDITNLSNLSGINTGDQDLSTLATKTELSDSVVQIRSEIPDVSSFIASETDPTFSSSQAANITATDITNLSNLSGINTGDQDLSTLATKTELSDSVVQIRSEIPDVSGFISSEVDPNVPEGTQIGEMQYWDGVSWEIVASGNTGQILTVNTSGIPEWQNPSALKTAYTTRPNINTNGVKFNGIVNANGYSSTILFEYGLNTNYDSTITAITSPVSGTTNETVSSVRITNLTLGAVYHVRMVVINIFGTFYSNDFQFTNLYYGAEYEGGFVFNFDDSGHGRVCYNSDAPNRLIWDDAMNYCANLSGGINGSIYNDWFLPEIEDLILLGSNYPAGLPSVSILGYWSSTLYNNNIAYFLKGLSKLSEPKTHDKFVRAVRTF
ncbi:MAG: DUF1566 domain-containing protein [Chitinophagales bacterium]|nr:DUF1566 domain-containing protein [Chitinophagales bacterium]